MFAPTEARPRVTTSERLATALLAVLASIVIVAYLVDWAGGAFTPWLMLAAGIVSGAAAWFVLGHGVEHAPDDPWVYPSVVGGAFAWLLWIARPALLPLGTGPDLTHHLLLIGYIEKHWRLVHAAGVEAYLGEMVYYTPGSHILVSLAGAWTGSSGLRVFHGVLAAAVALKAGYVFLIARRVLPADLPRSPLALCAVVALFASQTYFLSSFAEYSFLAQVIAELFAVATWWGLVAWHQTADSKAMAFAGLALTATFLTWPIFIGPPMVLAAVVVLWPRGVSRLRAITHALLASVPFAIVAGLFIMSRLGMMMIAGAGGEAVWPKVTSYGWPLLVMSTAGLLLGAVPLRRHRFMASSVHLVPLFAVAILVQAAALFAFARANGNVPYMALKMFYLLLYPQAVGVAVLVATVYAAALGARRFPAWAIVALAVILVGRPLWGAPASLNVGHHPAISEPLQRAGEWARDHVPRNCVEYLVPDDETAYWLHLAVLGNPRQGARTADNATYELTPALVRWLTPGGLPYAIADLPALPRGIREELDVAASFGTAAVVKRRGPASCAGS